MVTNFAVTFVSNENKDKLIYGLNTFITDAKLSFEYNTEDNVENIEKQKYFKNETDFKFGFYVDYPKLNGKFVCLFFFKLILIS